MKPGFTLIELLIAMLVSSMLALVLYGALWQASRQSGWFDNRLSVGMRAAAALHQLEYDISGAFVPLSEQKEPSSDKNEKKPVAKKDEERKPLQKIFYSKNANGRLRTLTFVSNNPLSDAKEIKPRIVRIMYQVEPETKEKKSFKLVRQEATDLDPEELDKVPKDILIGGIQNVTISYLATKEEEEVVEHTTFKDWIVEDDKEGAELQKEKILPQAAIITLTLWSRDKKRTKEFKTTVLIPGHTFVHKEKDQASKPEKVPEKPKSFGNNMSKEDLQKIMELVKPPGGAK